jgi:ATP-dependent helicase/nuclease subunit B
MNTVFSPGTARMSSYLTPLLQPHTTTLTANSRLARTLHEQIDQFYHATGVATWETPHILPLASWLTTQFYQHNDDGLILLTDPQEHTIWEKIITESEITPALLHPAELANLVKSAYHILLGWEIPLTELKPFQTQLEVKCTLQWIETFESICQQKNWISNAKLPNYLSHRYSKNTLSLPNKILLSGFDTLNPTLEKLFSLLQEKISIDRYEPQAIESCATQVILENTEIELTTMAKWLKAQWQKNPKAKLGCIIPELSSLRKMVLRVMTSVFCIENNLPTTEIRYPPFNISAGAPLAEHSMIHTALTLLTWCHHALPIEAIANILQSPYLCENEIDAANGAKIDALLREQNRLFISITDLFYTENKSVNRWRSLLACAKEKNNALLTPSEWTTHFIDLLKMSRWPGNKTQSSESFQALESFKKLLQEMQQFDLIVERISYAHALQLLNTLAHKTIFQPKSHNEPIQIMGTLESSGIVFDAVWVMGLHDGIWPAPSKPNPLIPFSIQQHYQTPHATAARELAFCENVTKRLMRCAREIIFSSPKKQDDQHLSPSRLIAPIPQMDPHQILIDHTISYTQHLFDQRNIENDHDEKAPTLSESRKVRGGSMILKSQALCPFKAFAEARLKARKLNKPEMGVTHLMRGVLTHHILFELWDHLKSQAALNALSDEALKKLIDEKIEKTFTNKTFQIPITENKPFFDIEKKRLQIVLFHWMQIEKLRPPFRIHALETSDHITIDQLPINIRLDRIDELADGSLALVDYKTGKNHINTILKETLIDPQLPIYAVFHEKNKLFETIAFAGLNQADMGFNGISHENKTNIKNNHWYVESIEQKKNELGIHQWETLVSHWEKSIEKLAHDFCAGDARVAPIDETICEQCGLKSLCRKQP